MIKSERAPLGGLSISGRGRRRSRSGRLHASRNAVELNAGGGGEVPRDAAGPRRHSKARKIWHSHYSARLSASGWFSPRGPDPPAAMADLAQACTPPRRRGFARRAYRSHWWESASRARSLTRSDGIESAPRRAGKRAHGLRRQRGSAGLRLQDEVRRERALGDGEYGQSWQKSGMIVLRQRPSNQPTARRARQDLRAGSARGVLGESAGGRPVGSASSCECRDARSKTTGAPFAGAALRRVCRRLQVPVEVVGQDRRGSQV